jgi:hypothetical protein
MEAFSGDMLETLRVLQLHRSNSSWTLRRETNGTVHLQMEWTPSTSTGVNYMSPTYTYSRQPLAVTRKSPSTVRRDRTRLLAYLRSRHSVHEPGSSKQNTPSINQVSASTSTHNWPSVTVAKDTRAAQTDPMPITPDKVSVSAQTNYLVTAPKSVQATTNTCDTGTSCKIVPVSCESANQTVTMSTRNFGTQTDQAESHDKKRPYVSHGRADCVLGYRGQSFDEQALIRWQGQPRSRNTWVPCMELGNREFEDLYKDPNADWEDFYGDPVVIRASYLTNDGVLCAVEYPNGPNPYGTIWMMTGPVLRQQPHARFR